MSETMGQKTQRSSHELGRLGKPFFLPVGIPLQIEIEGVSFRMTSTSVGYFADSCLIIRHPSTPMSISRMLFKGNKVTVRYVDGGNAFGFESELIGLTEEPAKMLFISYPLHIVRKSLRNSRRTECHLPAKLLRRDRETNKDTGVGEGIIVDISRTGCGFTMPRESSGEALVTIRAGDTVVLEFQLPGTENSIALEGEVRRMQHDMEKTNSGILFYEIEETLKEKIVGFISALERFDWDTH